MTPPPRPMPTLRIAMLHLSPKLADVGGNQQCIEGEWEEVSRNTGLPLFVANRTGADPALDFHASESVVAHRGARVFSRASRAGAIFLIDWDFAESALVAASSLPIPPV